MNPHYFWGFISGSYLDCILQVFELFIYLFVKNGHSSDVRVSCLICVKKGYGGIFKVFVLSIILTTFYFLLNFP
jgi:hypothetical protein